MKDKYILGNQKLVIIDDINPISPREDDSENSTMFIWHKRYDMGDKAGKPSPEEVTTWPDMENFIKEYFNVAVILPIFMYDHSGVIIKNSPFANRFDSGQVGFIFMTEENIKNVFGDTDDAKDRYVKAVRMLIDETDRYSHFIGGEVYGFNLYEAIYDEDGNPTEALLDTSSNFFGMDARSNGMLQQMPVEFRRLIEEEYERKKRV